MSARGAEATPVAVEASSKASTRGGAPAGEHDDQSRPAPAPSGGPWDLAGPTSGIAVIGLGNVVFSDDGAGVEAVRRLRTRYAIPPGVDVIEGHTAGLTLLPFLADAERAILVDAVRLPGRSPGELVRVDPRAWSTTMTQRMTPHDIGVTDLLGAAELTGVAPRELVLWCVQADRVTLGTQMTSAVAGALDALADEIAGQLQTWGVELAPVVPGDAGCAAGGSGDAWTVDRGLPPTGEWAPAHRAADAGVTSAAAGTTDP